MILPGVKFASVRFYLRSSKDYICGSTVDWAIWAGREKMRSWKSVQNYNKTVADYNKETSPQVLGPVPTLSPKYPQGPVQGASAGASASTSASAQGASTQGASTQGASAASAQGAVLQQEINELRSDVKLFWRKTKKSVASKLDYKKLVIHLKWKKNLLQQVLAGEAPSARRPCVHSVLNYEIKNLRQRMGRLKNKTSPEYQALRSKYREKRILLIQATHQPAAASEKKRKSDNSHKKTKRRKQASSGASAGASAGTPVAASTGTPAAASTGTPDAASILFKVMEDYYAGPAAASAGTPAAASAGTPATASAGTPAAASAGTPAAASAGASAGTPAAASAGASTASASAGAEAISQMNKQELQMRLRESRSSCKRLREQIQLEREIQHSLREQIGASVCAGLREGTRVKLPWEGVPHKATVLKLNTTAEVCRDDCVHKMTAGKQTVIPNDSQTCLHVRWDDGTETKYCMCEVKQMCINCTLTII